MSGEFQKIGLNQIVVGERHRKDLGDIAALAKSIAALGMLQPVVVRRAALENGCPKYRLVAGSRRLAAAGELKWATVPAHVVDNLDDAAAALRAERDENTCRKDFTPSEAVAIGRALEELERPQAAKRKTAGTNQYTEPSGKLPEGSRGDTRDKVAAAVGVSGRTYEKAKVVVQAAEDNPELAPVVEEMDRSKKVDPAYRKVAGKKKPRRVIKMDDGEFQKKVFHQILQERNRLRQRVHDLELGQSLETLRAKIAEAQQKAKELARLELDLAAREAGPPSFPAVVQRWYRDLCRRYHPDRGGSHLEMKVVNEAHESLKKLVGVN
jgi:ParB-like chromosome segregation protein Spo0J